MSAPTITFWYDFASTYSYLAAMTIDAKATAAGAQVVWRPFLLGPLFAAQGWTDSPFNLYPAKGAYMWRDMERLCARHDLPWRRPSVFPRHSVAAARLAVALAATDVTDVPAFSKAVYAANFVDDQDIADPAVLAKILAGVGAPVEPTLTQAQTTGIRQALRTQTEQAQALGLFGAPTFTIDHELFWGADRLDDALAWATSPKNGAVERNRTSDPVLTKDVLYP